MKYEWQKAGKTVLAATVLLALGLSGADAWARGGHGGGHGGGHAGHSGGRSGSHHHHHGAHRFSGSSSSVFFGSYWAFPAYWYSQAAPYLLQEPVHYIERSEEELRSPSMWYYCESAAAYYPYVSQCPAGWVQVEPFNVP